MACERGHVAVVEVLLQIGADHAMRDLYGWTALHCASSVIEFGPLVDETPELECALPPINFNVCHLIVSCFHINF